MTLYNNNNIFLSLIVVLFLLQNNKIPLTSCFCFNCGISTTMTTATNNNNKGSKIQYNQKLQLTNNSNNNEEESSSSSSQSTASISSSSSTFNNILQQSYSLLLNELWFLILLSFLSGISPSIKIISQSHISRLPDCPIAHDIDTLLLWPAIQRTIDTRLGGGGIGIGTTGIGRGGDNVVVEDVMLLPPRTLFQDPIAAITDQSMYDVDWSSVITTYMSNILPSLCISMLFSIWVVSLMKQGLEEEEEEEEEEEAAEKIQKTRRFIIMNYETHD